MWLADDSFKVQISLTSAFYVTKYVKDTYTFQNVTTTTTSTYY